MTLDSDLEAILEVECRQVLERNQIGRLVFTSGDELHVHPVNYGLDHDGAIVFRTGRGAKLRSADGQVQPVAFEVEEVDPRSGDVTAVVVAARMQPVLDLASGHRLARLAVEPWPAPRARCRWIRLAVETIEGWRLPAPSSAAPRPPRT